MKKLQLILLLAALSTLANAQSTPPLSTFTAICTQSASIGNFGVVEYGPNITLEVLESEMNGLLVANQIPIACPAKGSDTTALFFVPSVLPNPSNAVQKANLFGTLVPLRGMRSFFDAYVQASQSGSKTRPAPPEPIWSVSMMPLSLTSTATRTQWSQALNATVTQLKIDWKASHPNP